MNTPCRTLAFAIVIATSAGACRAAVQTAAAPEASAAPDEQRLRVAQGGAQAQQDRQVIRNGRMGVEVETLATAAARFEQAAAALSAQIQRATTAEKSADYIVRVPAATLTALMDSAAALGGVKSRTVSATDVTDQVIDTEARLNALRATRDRLRQLLERAAEVQDVVTVERELARVQGELESLEARLERLRTQVAMSELSLRLSQRHVLGPLGVVAVGLANLLGKLFVIR